MTRAMAALAGLQRCGGGGGGRGRGKQWRGVCTAVGFDRGEGGAETSSDGETVLAEVLELGRGGGDGTGNESDLSLKEWVDDDWVDFDEEEASLSGEEGEEDPVTTGGEGLTMGDQGVATKDPSEMRLSRRIARSGIASRREAER